MNKLILILNNDDNDKKESTIFIDEGLLFFEDHGILISSVRKTAKLFRKLPHKNNTRKHIWRTDLGRNLMSFLYTKSRWNSLISMVRRFLKLKNVIG